MPVPVRMMDLPGALSCALLLLLLPLGAGCDTSGDACAAGTLNCTCYATGNCRGELRCLAGVCRGGMALDGAVKPLTCDDDCDDNVGCTEDSCIEGVCAHMPTNDRCNDGQSCDLLVGGCVTGETCGSTEDCQDDDICTVDERCQPSTRTCVYMLLDGDDDGVPPTVCGGHDPDDGTSSILGNSSKGSGGKAPVSDGDAGN